MCDSLEVVVMGARSAVRAESLEGMGDTLAGKMNSDGRVGRNHSSGQ